MADGILERCGKKLQELICQYQDQNLDVSELRQLESEFMRIHEVLPNQIRAEIRLSTSSILNDRTISDRKIEKIGKTIEGLNGGVEEVRKLLKNLDEFPNMEKKKYEDCITKLKNVKDMLGVGFQVAAIIGEKKQFPVMAEDTNEMESRLLQKANENISKNISTLQDDIRKLTNEIEDNKARSEMKNELQNILTLSKQEEGKAHKENRKLKRQLKTEDNELKEINSTLKEKEEDIGRMREDSWNVDYNRYKEQVILKPTNAF